MGEFVLDYIHAGISIVPLKCDGSKRPWLPWKPYQTHPPSETNIGTWYDFPGRVLGTAVICGVVSGGLEVLDFDHDAEATYAAWRSETDLVSCRLPVVETPSFGFHVYYRCDVICGNEKISMSEDGDVLIESRGEGGYVVSPLSPSTVHQRNYPYVQVAGPVLPEIPRILPEERRFLWEVAASLDRGQLRHKAVEAIRKRKATPAYVPSESDRPGDIYNRRGDWPTLLSGHGWGTTDQTHWRHPDAKSGHAHSAKINTATNGDQVLRVFSTSTSFETDRSYSLFEAYSVLNGVSRSEAAKRLHREGFKNAG